MNVLEYINKISKYHRVIDEIKDLKNPLLLTNASSGLTKLLITNAYLQTNVLYKTYVIVYPNIFYANIAYEEYLDILPADQVSFFPVEEFVSLELVASSNFRKARIKTIQNILNNKPQVIITCTEGLTYHTMSKERMMKSIFSLKVGQIITINELATMLIERGYKKMPITEVSGTFSVRGSLVDLFIINSNEPVRINFFDNEIETIKLYNIETQLSYKQLNEIEICSFLEIFYEEKEIPIIEQNILSHNIRNDKINKDLEAIKDFNLSDSLYTYLPDIDPYFIPFIDLIKDKTIILNEFNNISQKHEQNLKEIYDYYSREKIIPNSELFKTPWTIIANNDKNLFITQFSSLNDEIEVNNKINLQSSNLVDYNNNLNSLVNELKITNKYTYVINHLDNSKLETIEELLKNHKLDYVLINDYNKIIKNKINLIVSNNLIGFNDYELNLQFITPNDFSSGKITKHHKYQNIYNKSVQIFNKEELMIGDYVVHRDYGIGKYLGIKTIDMKDIHNDYLQIEYANDSKLYIPIENIYVLEKYVGSYDKIPKLSKAGGKEWQKKKARINEKVLEIAKKLIKIQAQRELLKGYIYPKDSQEQLLFEQDFGYNETKDQIKAIHEVKADLESDKPLDRLICGDVGFGKTEVAMRGAFKVVEAGKQVAYLAPTTVLSRQHYLNFKERFEKYGIRVELLSRFVDYKTIKATLKGLKEGYVDIVVGTHRLLSDDVKFKDLGLLIIDEEHRFGVEHKERIKEIKANVDVLSLSATPIPRTLQMSLSGLRDLSLIETPPVNRLSIQTYVLEKNDAIIREAINRELGREGQVFYLLNRIGLLDDQKRKLQKLVPFAKIAIIHGKMDRDEIEDVLNLFINKQYNVLLCTTIIETGIDIPNANTIIIERADTLGLAQIYQIRGRVGRSERLAYAYLMYEKDGTLTETSKKRLETIKQFTQLGSGYKVAMRDLSIRGTGDILGSEQSGFIDDIGIDLYLKLLNEAIETEKGIIKKQEEYKSYAQVSKHIDEKYVSDDSIRIIMHQEIAKVKSKEQKESLLLEFLDRYGRVNEELKIYIESKYFEHLCKIKGIEAFKEQKSYLEMNFDPDKTSRISYPLLLKLANESYKNWKFKYLHQRIYIQIPLNDYNKALTPNHYIYSLTSFMEKI